MFVVLCAINDAIKWSSSKSSQNLHSKNDEIGVLVSEFFVPIQLITFTYHFIFKLLDNFLTI
jgi:hypothetical protein